MPAATRKSKSIAKPTDNATARTTKAPPSTATTAAKGKGRAAPKRKAPVDEDDEDEEEPAAPAPKRRATKKRVEVQEVEEEEEEEHDDDGDDDADEDHEPEEEEDDDEEDGVEEEEDEDEEIDMDDDPAPSKSSSRPKRKTKPVVRAKDDSRNFKPLLAEKWDLEKGRDPTGWHVSEKLDGVRAYWTGTRFQSREGNPFDAPYWFTKRFPRNVTLDGELFTQRAGFQDAVSIVKGSTHSKWKYSITYEVFDCPSKGHLPFEERMKFLKKLLEDKIRIRWVNVVKHTVVKDKDHVMEMLDDVCNLKGEGLMLREPGSVYVNGRSKSLLKVKRFFDADAIIRGYEQGSGKNSSVVGALRVEMLDAVTGKPNGTLFKVGSGLTDKQRKHPPKIGATIIYRYQELSRAGNPRFPTYVGERAD